MNKKSIGEFIAALRKVNGMTQKQLADLLNVSDKTVSRWERDEGVPDLSLIPVIAEIFNVTCDELLKGERNSVSSDDAAVEPDKPDVKSEKQRQRMLKNTLFAYKNRSYIAIGISFAGFIAALICNFAFLRGNLGVLLGLIFFVGSIVCQAIFLNKALFSVEDSDLDKEALCAFKYNVILLAEKSIGLTLFLLGFCLPMLLAPTFTGLQLKSFIKLGSPVALVLTGIYILVSVFINKYLFQKWCIQEEILSAIKQFNQKVKKNLSANKKKYKCLLKCGIVLFVLLFLTYGIHITENSFVWSTNTLLHNNNYGLKFYDFDDFKQYLAARNELDYEYQKEMNLPYKEEPIPDILKSDLERRVYLPDGTYVYYINRNYEVYEVFSETDEDSSEYYIRVIRNKDYKKAHIKSILFNCLYSLLYVVEVGGVIIYYMKKRVTFSNKQELPS